MKRSEQGRGGGLQHGALRRPRLDAFPSEGHNGRDKGAPLDAALAAE